MQQTVNVAAAAVVRSGRLLQKFGWMIAIYVSESEI